MLATLSFVRHLGGFPFLNPFILSAKYCDICLFRFHWFRTLCVLTFHFSKSCWYYYLTAHIYCHFVPCEFSTIVLWPPSFVLLMQPNIYTKSRNIVDLRFLCIKFLLCACRSHRILYSRKNSSNRISFRNFNPWFVFNLCNF